MSRASHPSRLSCIIPNRMLKALLADDDLREVSMRALLASSRLRERRTLLGAMPSVKQAGEERRTIYDARKSTQLPGKLVRGEDDPPSSDRAVNEAHDGLGATYDLFSNVYGRNSVDDHGLRLDASVHYDVDFDNAFWDGQQMVFGDGDGKVFRRGAFTAAIDVIGHE